MDAHDQILLSEGFCSQLGILKYHKNIWLGRDLHSIVANHANQGTDAEQGNQGTDADQASVPVNSTYQVCLQQPVTIPASKVVSVPVVVEEDCFRVGPLLMECDGSMPKQCGLAMEDALLQPSEEGLGSLKVYNVSSFTEKMEEGMILGNAVEACIVEPAEECSST